MKNNLYTILDTKAKIFHPPFTAVNHPVAIRQFTRGLTDNPDAADYDLYHCGTWDDNNATVLIISAIIVQKGATLIQIDIED